ATVDSDTPDPDPGNNTGGSTPEPEASADVGLTKTVDNPAPSVGTDVTFTLTATKAGPSEASGVSVTDKLPSGYEFVSANASSGSYDAGSGLWTVGTLANRATASLDITATVLAGGDYKNTATIESDTPDPNPDDNTEIGRASRKETAEVSLTKTVDKAATSVDKDANFTLTATNSGHIA